MNLTTHISTRRASGFTLIELMIAMVIAAVLLAISVPTYQSQIRKSRRTEAKTALLDLAGREERLFAVTNAYSNAVTDLGYTSGTFPVTVGSGYYRVDISNFSAANSTFTLTATPYTTDQAKDTTCAQMSITHLNVQAAKNSASADTTTTCWR